METSRRIAPEDWRARPGAGKNTKVTREEQGREGRWSLRSLSESVRGDFCGGLMGDRCTIECDLCEFLEIFSSSAAKPFSFFTVTYIII